MSQPQESGSKKRFGVRQRSRKILSFFRPTIKADSASGTAPPAKDHSLKSKQDTGGSTAHNTVSKDTHVLNPKKNIESNTTHTTSLKGSHIPDSNQDIESITSHDTISTVSHVQNPEQSNESDPTHSTVLTGSHVLNPEQNIQTDASHVVDPKVSNVLTSNQDNESSTAHISDLNKPKVLNLDQNIESQVVHDTLSKESKISQPVENNLRGEAKLKPIRELWKEAYEDLRREDEALVIKYEAKLSESLPGKIALSSSLAGDNLRVEDLMQSVVTQKLAQYKADEWKVKALGEEFLVKDLTKPLVGIIKWADKFVGDALASNPMASIGWAAVMVFVPLLLNPLEQQKALLEGLASICNMQVRSTMQENLYFQRYEANPDNNNRKDFMPAHQGYRDTLKALYVLILKYHATSVCYFTKDGGLRILADMVEWHKWEDLLKEAQKQDKEMCRTYDLMSNVKIEEEFEKLDTRHTHMTEILSAGFTDVAALRQAVESVQQNAKRKELLDWLSPIDPSENYNNARSKHDNGGQGTGDWLIWDNEDFDEWKRAPRSLIWLNGKAGSGKSVLSSSVIRHLKETYTEIPQVAVAYFYFSFNDGQKQTVIGMMESIIKQICCCRPRTPLSIKALEDLKARGHRPDLERLQKVLLAILPGFFGVYVIIDALDECPSLDGDRERLLKCLNFIHQRAPGNLHMFWTSRREKDIETSYRSMQPDSKLRDINLSSYKPAIDHDIGLLIDSTLVSSSYDSWPEYLKVEARQELIKKSDGMFQYVACQFEELRKLVLPKKLRQALNDLPKGLDATYDRMFARIDPEEQKQVARVLEWLCFSTRPLLLEEIAEIFILDPEASVPFDDENRLLAPRAVLEFLSGLVTETSQKLSPYEVFRFARQGDEVVEIRLAHFSIKEYLVSSRIASAHSDMFGIEEHTAHLHITGSCIAYHLQLSQTILATKEMMRKYYLWDYVVTYWPKHFDLVSHETCPKSIEDNAGKIFTQGTQSLLNMARIRDPYRNQPEWGMTAEKLGSPLYFASLIGSVHLTQLIIKADQGSSVNDVSIKSRFGTALQAAVASKHDSIAQLLLKAGADVNAQGGFFGNAIQAAAYSESTSIVQLLLDKGANVNAQGGEYGNALQAAAYYGSTSIVQLLLDKGADVNAQGGHFGNALQAAVARGIWEIGELLIAKGAKVDRPGPEWEKLLTSIGKVYGIDCSDRLRNFQTDPTIEGLAKMREE